MTSHTLPRKKLPIGIQSFAKLRKSGCYYVDKTAFALRLIEQGGYYFLSRPRRFGKSLFVDTLKELFEGNQALFEGLYAEQHWDWSVQYPVIRLSFGSGILQNRAQLDAAILAQLSFYEQAFAVPVVEMEIPYRFQYLIRALHQQTGQRVVVLVDEYDKPTLDHLTQPDVAREMRNGLRNLYSVLKDSDADLKFVFFTGVSKFSKVSLFSELNNLDDITIDAEYSALCGYTDEDLDTVFAPELPGLDRQQIQAWYNGYNWMGTAVYNPFDLLLLFQKRQFRPFWFETGTPTFLVELLAQRQWFTPDLVRREVDDSIISSFDVDKMSSEALLWQTGYLTFHHVEQSRAGNWRYTLGYPNREVEAALNKALLPLYGPEPQPTFAARSELEEALYEGDLSRLKQSIHALFASIPHDWYRRNPLAQFEGHYASVFYSQLAALGLNVKPEDVTNHGRIDLSLQLEQHVYLFEFKVVDTEAEGKALQQLIAQGYAEKYRSPGITITLIGVEFSRAERNIVGWDVYQDAA
jgi:hypothetical protein